ncbi:MAG: RNA polymerase sigma factor [Actinomycetota bacterium]|nr:RNA polymerase sigma factor [Actinomycetota bacterium]
MQAEVLEGSLDALRACLVGQARGLLADAHEAEDVAQEALLAVVQRPERFVDEDHLSAYARATTRNLCVDRLRSRGRRAIPVADLPDAPLEWTETDTLELREAVTFVLAELRMLPPRYSAVLRASASLGSSDYAELAAATGESVTGVRNVLHRARHTLRVRAQAAGHSVGGVLVPLHVRAWFALHRSRRLAAAGLVPALVLPFLFGVVVGSPQPPAGKPEGSLTADPLSAAGRTSSPNHSTRRKGGSSLLQVGGLDVFSADAARLVRNPGTVGVVHCTRVGGHGLCSGQRPVSGYWTQVNSGVPGAPPVRVSVSPGRCQDVEHPPVITCVPA